LSKRSSLECSLATVEKVPEALGSKGSVIDILSLGCKEACGLPSGTEYSSSTFSFKSPVPAFLSSSEYHSKVQRAMLCVAVVYGLFGGCEGAKGDVYFSWALLFLQCSLPTCRSVCSCMESIGLRQSLGESVRHHLRFPVIKSKATSLLANFFLTK
jgi:hypothetical protein